MRERAADLIQILDTVCHEQSTTNLSPSVDAAHGLRRRIESDVQHQYHKLLSCIREGTHKKKKGQSTVHQRQLSLSLSLSIFSSLTLVGLAGRLLNRVRLRLLFFRGPHWLAVYIQVVADACGW